MTDFHPDQLTLGELITKLSKCKQDETVRFDFGGFVPDLVRSYRGYYDHLALGFTNECAPTVADVLGRLRAAVGATFQGYKGGDYVMTAETPMWAANNGETGDTAITGVEAHSWTVVMTTRFVP